jgi:GGDEF domain-containing protein
VKYLREGARLLNDRFGHLIGSQALCRLADVLFSCCRDIDTPARFCGDEFAVVLPETNTEAANSVAQRICESVANDDKGPRISASVGIAVYPQDGDTIEQLLGYADSALYSTKRHRNAGTEFSFAGSYVGMCLLSSSGLCVQPPSRPFAVRFSIDRQMPKWVHYEQSDFATNRGQCRFLVRFRTVSAVWY